MRYGWKMINSSALARLGAHRTMVGIACFAVLIRLLLIPALTDGWAAEDYVIAQQIAAGHGFQAPSLYGGELRPTSQKSPAVPYLLALSMLLAPGAQRVWFMVFQALAAGLGCYWTARLGVRTLGATSGTLAATFLAVFVPHIWWMRHLGAHIFAAAAVPGTLLLLYRARARASLASDAAWGAGLGLAGYFSADVLLPAPFLAMWLAWSRRDQGWRAVRGPLIAGLVALVLLSPWTLRNYRVHGRLVLVRTGFGTALYWGNNPDSTGTDWIIRHAEDGSVLYSSGRFFFDSELLGRLSSLSEVQQEDLLLHEALEWIVAHPGDAARLWVRKLGYFWWFTRLGDQNPVPWLREFAWGTVLLFALVGVGAALWRAPPAARLLPLLLPLVTSTLVHVTTVISSNWRMRIPIEPLVLLFTAYGLLILLAQRVTPPRARSG